LNIRSLNIKNRHMSKCIIPWPPALKIYSCSEQWEKRILTHSVHLKNNCIGLETVNKFV
jgi:hypothetical protein